MHKNMPAYKEKEMYHLISLYIPGLHTFPATCPGQAFRLQPGPGSEATLHQ